MGERKKVEKKVIPKVEPKKRPEPEPEPPVEKKARVKPSDDKYIKVCCDSTQDEFRLIGERVQKGELKWAYFASDSGKGYHHYIIVK